MKYDVIITVEKTAHGCPDKLELREVELNRINTNLQYAFNNYSVIGVEIHES